MSEQYDTCHACRIPAQQLSTTQLCCSCEWVENKDALCEGCDHAEMVDCVGVSFGLECLAGGYHCRHYHVNCDMMQPYQYEMFTGEQS